MESHVAYRDDKLKSGKTRDELCITVTVNLCKEGYLDPIRLSTADPMVIRDLIRRGGNYKRRAPLLIKMAKEIVDKFDGEPPHEPKHIESLPGIGRKAMNIAVTEMENLPIGVGTDMHIDSLVLSNGMAVDNNEEGPMSSEDVESSVSKWLHPRHYKHFNKSVGTFAQLYTQVLQNVNTGDKMVTLDKATEAIADYIHKKWHVKSIWFLIRNTRDYYQSKEEKERKRKKRKKQKKAKKDNKKSKTATTES